MSKAITRRPSTDVALPHYDEMCRAIAECARVDDVRMIRDKAQALVAYSRQANNREAEHQFADVKVRAEVKCGEFLREMAEAGQRETGGRPAKQSHAATVNLADVGISKSASSRYQEMAKVPKAELERHLKDRREADQPVTSASVRALTKQPKFTPKQQAEHERLWRVLRALEQISDQDIPPGEWLGALPDYMLARVATHLKRARPWLLKLFALWDKTNAH